MEDTASPATKTEKKLKAERQEIAAMNNRTTPWHPREQLPRNASNPSPRRPTAMAQNPQGGEKQGLTSRPAPYSISPTPPTGENGLASVGPCFVCQLVGHRAADCPKRRCYACGRWPEHAQHARWPPMAPQLAPHGENMPNSPGTK